MGIQAKHKQEISLLHGFIALFLILVVSGFSSYALNLIWGSLRQTLALVHLFVGYAITAIFFFYSYKHFKRTVGFRRTGSIILGVILFLATCYLALTGVLISFTGVLKKQAWLLDSHIVCAILTLFLLAIHLIWHYVTFPKNRRSSVPSRFVTLSNKIIRPILVGVGILCITTITLLTGNYLIQNSYSTSTVEDYLYAYGDGPFLPSLTMTASGTFVQRKHIAESAQCIECHKGIGEQWMSSTHRHAADDPTYVRNVNLLTESKGIVATRYCEGCHAPVALLTGQLTPGGSHGGKPDTVANKEGISCMSCHGVNHLTSSEGVASYRFSPRDSYLFANVDLWPLKFLHQQTLKLVPQRHTKDLLSPLLKESQFCSSCHTQFMDKSMNNWGWVKMQDEFLAWSNSKFNSPKEPRFSHPQNKQCQDCHMPMIKADDIAADGAGKVRSHYFVGANVMLAKHFDNETLFEMTKEFLQQDKIQLSIEPPEDEQAKQSALYLKAELRNQHKYPVAMYRGEHKKIKVLLTNQGVGHSFPGGTIDLNEAWIDFKVYDGQQRLVTSSGQLQTDGALGADTVVYKEIAIDRYGKEVWRHDLFNMVGRSYVNVIPAGSTDVVEFDLTVPDWAISPLTISATLKFRKLNQKYLDWVNLEQSVDTNPIIDIARDSVSVKVLKAPASQ